MPECSTNVEPKGKKDNLKQRNSASTAEHIEANVVDGAVGAKTDLQELTTSLKNKVLPRCLRIYLRPLQSLLNCSSQNWRYHRKTQRA